MSASASATIESPVELIDVREVARMLSISERHIWRSEDRGLMPRGVRIGASVRWSRSALEKWINDGCPPVRKPAR